MRDDVTFHNGNPFTAEDVVASLERVSHETSPLKGNLPAYVSSAVVDDHTVDITLNGTYPLLLNDLTNIHIFDEEWLVENDAELPTDIGANVEGFATYNANGTGPFIVESRQPDARTVFVVNPDWWDEPQHNLTGFELLPVNSPATRVAALLSGEISFTNDAPVQDLPRLEAAPNVEVLEGVDLRTVMIGFSFRDTLVDGSPNPFQDLKVRQALYQAIDIDQLQARVMRGKSRNAGTVVAPPIPGYVEAQDERLPYDPEAAKALLAEAGYGDGFSFGFNCLSDGLVNEEQFCQAIASMWSRIGLDPELDVAPRAVQTPKRTNGQTDVYTLGWATLPMLDSYSPLLQIFHTKEGNSGVFNWGDWSYPDLDALVQEAGQELDLERRLAAAGRRAADRQGRDHHGTAAPAADGLGGDRGCRGDAALPRQQAASLVRPDEVGRRRPAIALPRSWPRRVAAGPGSHPEKVPRAHARSLDQADRQRGPGHAGRGLSRLRHLPVLRRPGRDDGQRAGDAGRSRRIARAARAQ